MAKKVKTKAKKTRKIQGRDWHAWARKLTESGDLCYFAQPVKGKPITWAKWVRVKFVEVD